MHKEFEWHNAEIKRLQQEIKDIVRLLIDIQVEGVNEKTKYGISFFIKRNTL